MGTTTLDFFMLMHLLNIAKIISKSWKRTLVHGSRILTIFAALPRNISFVFFQLVKEIIILLSQQFILVFQKRWTILSWALLLWMSSNRWSSRCILTRHSVQMVLTLLLTRDFGLWLEMWYLILAHISWTMGLFRVS